MSNSKPKAKRGRYVVGFDGPLCAVHGKQEFRGTYCYPMTITQAEKLANDNKFHEKPAIFKLVRVAMGKSHGKH